MPELSITQCKPLLSESFSEGKKFINIPLRVLYSSSNAKFWNGPSLRSYLLLNIHVIMRQLPWLFVLLYSYRDESTSWLSPAMWSHGGSFPDGAVKERGHMMQFFVVVLCLIPVAFSTQIPVVSMNCNCNSSLVTVIFGFYCEYLVSALWLLF